jgi:hypothetical protein
MAEKRGGIGRLLKLALDALETGDASAMDPKLWATELRGNNGGRAPGLPKAGRIGSSNFGPVSNVCEQVALRGVRSEAWLRDFYERQGPGGDLGHCLLEPLSTTYGEAHIVSALIAYALGIKEAGPFLERELALCLLHRCPNKEVVSASTRAGAHPKQGHRKDFTALSLRLREGTRLSGGRRSLIERAFALENAWRCPEWTSWPAAKPEAISDWQLDVGSLLKSIRFASGPLVVTHHENGHVSRWERGPVCYASPLVAAVVSYEPFNVRYCLYPGKTAAPFGELRTIPSLGLDDPLMVVCRGTKILSEIDISNLGPVVAEHRFEEVNPL